MDFAHLRRILRVIALVMPLTFAGQIAGAQSLQDNLVAQLQAQGFVDFQISRTLLGRVQIIAIGPDFRREVVFNPNTGEILRDYLSSTTGTAPNPQLVAPERRERSDSDDRPSAPDRDRDNDRDDDKDDDKDDGRDDRDDDDRDDTDDTDDSDDGDDDDSDDDDHDDR